ncbi:MAG: hypothetical protein AAF804_18250, partial [Bacteroidota bacterium]
MRILTLICLLLMGGIGANNLFGQGQQQAFADQIAWKQRKSENFVVYYPEGNEASAGIVLRYAEQARFDLSALLDYRPDGPHTLFYLPQAQALLYSDFDLTKPDLLPGRTNVPDHFGIVVHPGTSQELYSEVKRQVARVLLQEFNYGYRLGSIAQTSLLFYDADWFTEGLADFMGYGWTFKDEQLIKTLTAYQLLELAQEGEGYLNRIARRSVWHYVTHEYGLQKLREIIYLANISHSIESGIISVLGITLNSLTSRWQQYMQKRLREQQNGRELLAEMNDALRLPAYRDGVATSFAHDPGGNKAAIYINRSGRQELFIYDQETRQYTSTSIKTGLSRLNGESLLVYPPLAWSHDGKTIATVIYDALGAQLVFYDVSSEEITLKELSPRIEEITHISWAYQDDRLAYSVRHRGKSDIWVAPKGSNVFVALTNDPYDDLRPTWSLDDQFIFFSSNRDSLAIDDVARDWEGHQRDFDLFKLKVLTETPELVQLTNTPDV